MITIGERVTIRTTNGGRTTGTLISTHCAHTTIEVDGHPITIDGLRVESITPSDECTPEQIETARRFILEQIASDPDFAELLGSPQPHAV